jgi:hypothetical protein
VIVKTAHIAQLAHEVNRAYCAALGDDSQKPWADAPDWQKNSAITGVELHLADPNAGAEASHVSWMAQKLEEGWVYGEEKNEEAKTHPCLVPFDELPVEHQAKDFLFRAVVHAVDGLLSGYVTTEEAEAKLASAVKEAIGAAIAPANAQAVPTGMLPVKYIGKRPTYKDGAYATGIIFEQGETKMVPQDVAVKMYGHKDVYVPGVAIGAATAEVIVKPKEGDTEQSLQDARDLVNGMQEKKALIEYAKTNFAGHQIANNLGIDKVRQKVLGLIDQYGISG